MHLHNINSPLQSVLVHAVLGGDGPRWQPLNGAGRHALLTRRQLESVLEGGNGGIQLRLGCSWEAAGGSNSGAGRLQRRRTLHLFVVRYIRPLRSFSAYLI
jgi:hypothetical protein